MGYTIDEIKKKVMPVAQKHKISEIYLFGSHARGDATENSDVDLAIDSTPLRGLLQLLAFQEEVVDVLACPVDVLTLGAMERERENPLKKEFLYNFTKERIRL